LLTYNKISLGILRFELNLGELFETDRERENFASKWPLFRASDQANAEIFELKRDKLSYKSEEIIPDKKGKRPPLLLLLGNPASHSIKSEMFFSYEANGREHRFWQTILKNSGVLEMEIDPNGSVDENNRERKDKLFNLSYKSPFRIGLAVFLSLPSAASGKWSGVAGVKKLFGGQAFARILAEERKRIIETSRKFLGSNGAVMVFQKDAWESLRPENGPDYSPEKASACELQSVLPENPQIKIFCVPPTRLAGNACRALKKYCSLLS